MKQATTLLLAISSLLIAGDALAQLQQPAIPANITVEFAEEPLVIDQVGLTVRLPVDCSVQTTRVGGVIQVQVTAADASWLMKIRIPETSNQETTPLDALDSAIDALRARFGIRNPQTGGVIETRAQVLDRIPNLSIDNQDASRAYLSVPRGESDRLVYGYTFFRPLPSRFVVMEIVAPVQEFARVRSIYETVVASSRFRDPNSIIAERGAAVQAGASFLASLNPAEYEAAMHREERWFRLHKPAPTGSPKDELEFGYRGIKFWEGQRGELNKGKSQGSWKSVERQRGYIAQVRARVVHGNQIIDTLGLFFMTPDRQHEAWNITTAVKDISGSKTLATARETGFRDGEDVQIAVDMPGKARKLIQPLIEGDGYLSQFETYVLPSLAVRRQIQTQIGFYAYRSGNESISLRRDDIRRDERLGGAWVIDTTLREGDEPQRSVFSENGRLIRTVLPDGKVWEPSDLRDILNLWRQKGLPTGEVR